MDHRRSVATFTLIRPELTTPLTDPEADVTPGDDDGWPWMWPRLLAVALLTFLVLGGSKLLAHNCLTRSLCCYRLAHQRRCLEQAEDADCQCDVRLPWYTSNLCLDSLSYTILLVLGFWGLSMTNVSLLRPREDVLYKEATTTSCGMLGTPSMCQGGGYLMAAALGNHAYRLVLAVTGPSASVERRFRLSLVYSAVAIAVYFYIVLSGDNFVLGFVGMIAQYYVPFRGLRHVLHLGQRSSRGVLMAGVCRLAVLAVCSMLLPIIYFSLYFSRGDVRGMSYLAFGVLIFTLTFYALAFVVTFVVAVLQTVYDAGIPANGDDSDTPTVGERTSLLSESHKLVFGDDRLVKIWIPTMTVYNSTDGVPMLKS